VADVPLGWAEADGCTPTEFVRSGGGSRSEPRPGVAADVGRTAPSTSLRAVLVATDTVLLAVAWSLAVVAASIWGGGLRVASVPLAVATGVASCAVLELYQYRRCVVRSTVVVRVGLAALATAGAIALIGTFTLHRADPTGLAVGAALSFVLLNLGRASYDRTVRNSRRQGRYLRPIVLVGSSVETHRLSELLAGHPELGYRPVGWVASEHDVAASTGGGILAPPVSTVGRVFDAMRRSGATGVLIAANGLGSEEVTDLARHLSAAGVHVHLSSGIMGIGHQRVRAHPLAHEPFFYVESARPSPVGMAVKRGIDVVLGTLLLVLAAPVMVVTALAVRLSDGGPVLFAQRRVGRGGQPIVVHKFRSMVPNAEARLADLEGQNERTGPLFKMDDDPRVTRIGHWIRATSIDELPQLFDVLEGRLSLVGPRPALPDEVESFDPELIRRASLRPGITGLWQVDGRHNSSFYAYKHLDLFYVENWSLRLDVSILAATVHVVASDTLGALRHAVRRRFGTAVEQPELPEQALALEPEPTHDSVEPLALEREEVGSAP
jgi:exopolysaccharide biosynthesis polyprenyl glycosylphosphotransferase